MRYLNIHFSLLKFSDLTAFYRAEEEVHSRWSECLFIYSSDSLTIIVTLFSKILLQEPKPCKVLTDRIKSRWWDNTQSLHLRLCRALECDTIIMASWAFSQQGNHFRLFIYSHKNYEVSISYHSHSFDEEPYLTLRKWSIRALLFLTLIFNMADLLVHL